MAIKRKGTTNNAPVNNEFTDAVWEDAPVEFDRRVAMVLIYGDTGTGRTRLALTMPGPIGLAHTAEKIDGLIQQFAKEKEIKLINFGGTFSGSEQDIADKAGAIWNRMSGGWFSAIDSWARTAVMDTATEGWEILRLARFGELNPRGRVDNLYGPVNAEWRSIFKHFRSQERCSVIAIGQTKDEYKETMKDGKKSSNPTGRTILAGQKEMRFMSDVVLRTSRSKDGGFIVTVEKAWFQAQYEGLEFENEDCRLPYILSIITETDESEWL